jgi:molybdopterin converting factor subunit 1
MIRILLFAQARDADGSDSIEWAVSEPQTADALWNWLATQAPRLGALRPICRVACNAEYLADHEIIRPGDEVAVIPPVSGG